MIWGLILAAVACICSIIALVAKGSKPNAISISFGVIGIIASFISLAIVAPRDLNLNIPGFDYLGFIVSILGILTAILLGWQLYNAFKVEEAKSVIEKYAKQVAEIQKGMKLLGDYVENPEYIYAITDAEDKFLFGIKREDGAIEWSVGIPKPIQAELEALKKRIAELEKKETNAPGTSGLGPEEPEA